MSAMSSESQTDETQSRSLSENQNPKPELKKKKKRFRNELSYAQNIRKKKRNSGEEYVTKSLKVVSSKVFENKNCFCSKKCLKTLSSEARRANFEKFWKVGDFKKQTLFLCEAVQKNEIKQRRPRTHTREERKWSYQYFLSAENQTKVPVCRTFFLDTFKISAGRVNRALNAETPGADLRGRMPGSSRKTSQGLVDIVKDYIHNFPRCSCENIIGKCLDSSLDVRKMYALYMNRFKSRQEQYVSECIYRKIFKTEFSLHFHYPRNGECHKCEFVEVKIDTENDDVLDFTAKKHWEVAPNKSVDEEANAETYSATSSQEGSEVFEIEAIKKEPEDE